MGLKNLKMNKIFYAVVAVLFISVLFMNNTKANAQTFGAEDENFDRVLYGLKKLNSQLVILQTEEMDSLKMRLEYMLREIEEVKHALPQLQGMVEQNKSETLHGLNETNSKINDLHAEIKYALPLDSIGDVIDQINAQNKRLDDTNSIFKLELIPVISRDMENLRQDMGHLKAGLAQDMENFYAKNQEFNQKLIKILEESLKQGVETKSILESINKKLTQRKNAN